MDGAADGVIVAREWQNDGRSEAGETSPQQGPPPREVVMITIHNITVVNASLEEVQFSQIVGEEKMLLKPHKCGQES